MKLLPTNYHPALLYKHLAITSHVPLKVRRIRLITYMCQVGFSAIVLISSHLIL